MDPDATERINTTGSDMGAAIPASPDPVMMPERPAPAKRAAAARKPAKKAAARKAKPKARAKARPKAKSSAKTKPRAKAKKRKKATRR